MISAKVAVWTTRLNKFGDKPITNAFDSIVDVLLSALKLIIVTSFLINSWISIPLGLYCIAQQTIGFIQYNRDIHSYQRKFRQLHLRIHFLDQSDTILIF